MNDIPLPLVFILFVIVVVIIGVLTLKADTKRREAFRLLAQRLGLTYSPEQNHDLASRYEFLNALGNGSNRYATHVLTGTFDGVPVTAFDYHYETKSSSKNGSSTRHHHLAVFAVTLPKAFPELTIRPEGMFSKIAQALGYDDIDFESAEFSRRYTVRSRDRKFAYAICHARTMEFLLEQEMDIEIEGRTLAEVHDSSLEPDMVEHYLRRVTAFRALMPDYVLTS